MPRHLMIKRGNDSDTDSPVKTTPTMLLGNTDVSPFKRETILQVKTASSSPLKRTKFQHYQVFCDSNEEEPSEDFITNASHRCEFKKAFNNESNDCERSVNLWEKSKPLSPFKNRDSITNSMAGRTDISSGNLKCTLSPRKSNLIQNIPKHEGKSLVSNVMENGDESRKSESESYSYRLFGVKKNLLQRSCRQGMGPLKQTNGAMAQTEDSCENRLSPGSKPSNLTHFGSNSIYMDSRNSDKSPLKPTNVHGLSKTSDQIKQSNLHSQFDSLTFGSLPVTSRGVPDTTAANTDMNHTRPDPVVTTSELSNEKIVALNKNNISFSQNHSDGKDKLFITENRKELMSTHSDLNIVSDSFNLMQESCKSLNIDASNGHPIPIKKNKIEPTDCFDSHMDVSSKTPPTENISSLSARDINNQNNAENEASSKDTNNDFTRNTDRPNHLEFDDEFLKKPDTLTPTLESTTDIDRGDSNPSLSKTYRKLSQIFTEEYLPYLHHNKENHPPQDDFKSQYGPLLLQGMHMHVLRNGGFKYNNEESKTTPSAFVERLNSLLPYSRPDCKGQDDEGEDDEEEGEGDREEEDDNEEEKSRGFHGHDKLFNNKMAEKDNQSIAPSPYQTQNPETSVEMEGKEKNSLVDSGVELDVTGNSSAVTNSCETQPAKKSSKNKNRKNRKAKSKKQQKVQDNMLSHVWRPWTLSMQESGGIQQQQFASTGYNLCPQNYLPGMVYRPNASQTYPSPNAVSLEQLNAMLCQNGVFPQANSVPMQYSLNGMPIYPFMDITYSNPQAVPIPGPAGPYMPQVINTIQSQKRPLSYTMQRFLDQQYNMAPWSSTPKRAKLSEPCAQDSPLDLTTGSLTSMASSQMLYSSNLSPVVSTHLHNTFQTGVPINVHAIPNPPSNGVLAQNTQVSTLNQAPKECSAGNENRNPAAQPKIPKRKAKTSSTQTNSGRSTLQADPVLQTRMFHGVTLVPAPPDAKEASRYPEAAKKVPKAERALEAKAFSSKVLKENNGRANREKPPPYGTGPLIIRDVTFGPCPERDIYCDDQHQLDYTELTIPNDHRQQEEMRQALLRLFSHSTMPPVPTFLANDVHALIFYPKMHHLFKLEREGLNLNSLEFGTYGLFFANPTLHEMGDKELNDILDQMFYTGSDNLLHCLVLKRGKIRRRCHHAASEVGKMRRHVKNHFPDKKWVCCFCRRQMPDSTDVERHSSTHTNVRPYQCDLCENRYGQKVTLETHMKSAHKSTLRKVDPRQTFTCRQDGEMFYPWQRQACQNHLFQHHRDTDYVERKQRKVWPFNVEEQSSEYSDTVDTVEETKPPSSPDSGLQSPNTQ